MVSKYRKPRKYDQEPYPLHHRYNIETEFDLHGSDTQNCTNIPLMYTRNGNAGRVNPESIEVHPMHTNFAIETGGLCNYMSIMTNFSAQLTLTGLKAFFTTNGNRAVKAYIGFYRCAFEDVHDKEDINTTSTVDAILHLTKNTTDKDIMPLYDNTKLSSGSYHMSTVNDTAEGFADLDLDTSTAAERVSFSIDTYFKSQQYYSNAKFVKGVLPKLIPIVLTPNRPFRKINIKNIPSNCRRGNDYMLFSFFVYIPIAGDVDQFFTTADVTQLPHVRLSGHVHFLEWNSKHDQTEA